MKVGFKRERDKRERWMPVMHGLAMMHGMDFFNFAEDNVDLENQTILGEYWDVGKGDFVEKLTPFSEIDIISDSRTWKDFGVRDQLRQAGIITTWVNLGGKTKVSRILQGTPLSGSFTQTYQMKDIAILEMIEKYGEIVVKPDDSSFGRGVRKISRLGPLFRLQLGDKTETLTMEQLLEKEREFKQQKFILQEYVHSRTLAGNPFDIRVYMMRGGENGDGKWVGLTPIPRIGNAGGLVSNTGVGGNANFYPVNFLKSEFGGAWQGIYEDISRLAYTLPRVLQRYYKSPLTMLGLDIGIDRRTHQLKLFEVNGSVHRTQYKAELCQNHINIWKFLYNRADSARLL
ncbi:MAG: YheC/YheD family protein [Defluviitaleaceae bacterium]|nr:YheC/YheD family protein [Defluviitaleaceae bacterium]